MALGAVFGAALCGASVLAARPYLPPPAFGEPAGATRVAASRLQCLTMVSPRFPLDGGRAPIAVVIEVVVSRSGSVSPIRMISGPRLFEADALDAVRLWRYRPYLVDGDPITVTTEVTVTFTPGSPGGMVSHPGS